MCQLTCENWIYVFSLSLQLAGALILLFNQVTKKGIREADKSMPETSYEPTEEEMLANRLKQLRDIYRGKYIVMHYNRFAFTYLALGYLISIWAGNLGANRVILFVLVLGITLIISLLTKIMVGLLANKDANEITIEDIKKTRFAWIPTE